MKTSTTCKNERARICIPQDADNTDRAPLAKCYDKMGHHIGTITALKIRDLWKRYHAAYAAGIHTKLGSVGTFEEEILLLLQRYPISGTTDGDKRTHLRNHWTTPDQFIGAIHAGFSTTTECFASPLNVHPDTTHYCSKYPEDTVFGSLGSMYDIRPTGSFEFNPEYTPVELQKAIKWVATAANLETSPVLGVGIFPDWSATAEQKTIEYLTQNYARGVRNIGAYTGGS